MITNEKILQNTLKHDSFNNAEKNKEGYFQVIDFFSGCGGMSSGFHALSRTFPGVLRILGACDINPDAVKSYGKNYNAMGVNQDIKHLLGKVEFQKFIQKIGYDPNKPTIVIGCAPCQGFTSHRKKNWDKKDARNN